MNNSTKKVYDLYTQKINQDSSKQAKGFIICKDEELEKTLDKFYAKMESNEQMKNNTIGAYAYEKGKTDECISERLNPNFKRINGVSTSRKKK